MVYLRTRNVYRQHSFLSLSLPSPDMLLRREWGGKKKRMSWDAYGQDLGESGRDVTMHMFPPAASLDYITSISMAAGVFLKAQ